jgi:uncharacterized protein (DUF302 family)
MSSPGVTDLRSHHSVPETINRLESLAKAHGLTIFARIDFSGDAQHVGLHLRPTQMLLFGNPRGGTPLLAAAPRVGLDLPIKALAWEDVDGSVWLSSNTPEYVVHRHGVPDDLAGNLAPVHTLLETAAH